MSCLNPIYKFFCICFYIVLFCVPFKKKLTYNFGVKVHQLSLSHAAPRGLHLLLTVLVVLVQQIHPGQGQHDERPHQPRRRIALRHLNIIPHSMLTVTRTIYPKSHQAHGTFFFNFKKLNTWKNLFSYLSFTISHYGYGVSNLNNWIIAF